MSKQKVEAGSKVEAGEQGTDSYDTGIVLAVDGDRAQVGWDSGVRTWIELSELRAVTSGTAAKAAEVTSDSATRSGPWARRSRD